MFFASFCFFLYYTWLICLFNVNKVIVVPMTAIKATRIVTVSVTVSVSGSVSISVLVLVSVTVTVTVTKDNSNNSTDNNISNNNSRRFHSVSLVKSKYNIKAIIFSYTVFLCSFAINHFYDSFLVLTVEFKYIIFCFIVFCFIFLLFFSCSKQWNQKYCKKELLFLIFFCGIEVEEREGEKRWKKLVEFEVTTNTNRYSWYLIQYGSMCIKESKIFVACHWVWSNLQFYDYFTEQMILYITVCDK